MPVSIVAREKSSVSIFFTWENAPALMETMGNDTRSTVMEADGNVHDLEVLPEENQGYVRWYIPVLQDSLRRSTGGTSVRAAPR